MGVAASVSFRVGMMSIDKNTLEALQVCFGLMHENRLNRQMRSFGTM